MVMCMNERRDSHRRSEIMVGRSSKGVNGQCVLPLPIPAITMLSLPRLSRARRTVASSWKVRGTILPKVNVFQNGIYFNDAAPMTINPQRHDRDGPEALTIFLIIFPATFQHVFVTDISPLFIQVGWTTAGKKKASGWTKQPNLR